MSLKRTMKPAVMHTVGHTTPAVVHQIQSRNGTTSSGTRSNARRSRGTTRKATSPARKRSSGSARSGGGAVILKAGSQAAKNWGKKMAALRKKKAKGA